MAQIVGHDSEVEMLDKKLKKLLEDLAKTKVRKRSGFRHYRPALIGLVFRIEHIGKSAPTNIIIIIIIIVVVVVVVVVMIVIVIII